MKSLVQFISEASENPFNYIYNNFMSAGGELADEDPAFDKEVKAVINQFIKDNGITSVNQVKIESSVPEYWKDFGVKGVKKNKDFDFGAFKNSLEDMFSYEYKGDKIYISSQTGSASNGDYFDAVISKK